MPDDVVLGELRGQVAIARLNRPDARNALSTELLALLGEMVEAWDADPEVRCIVIAGSDEYFAAGADIKAMRDRSFQDAMVTPTAGFWPRLAATKTPLVAAVSGFALGGGCELALHCDMIVASETAEFGQPEILLGIIPGAGGTQRLTRLVGPAKAKDLIFSGRFVSADEALAIGLVDEVVEATDVYAAARRRLAPYVGGPAQAIRAAKEAIDRGAEVDLDTGLEIERMLFAGLFATKDRETGMRSFVENGPGKAKFEGA